MPKYCVIIDIPEFNYSGDEGKLIEYFKHILKSSPLVIKNITVAVSRKQLVDIKEEIK